MKRRDFVLGATAASLAAGMPALAQAPRQGRWLRLESANFIIYIASPEKEARAEVAALEAFHGVLMSLAGKSALKTARKLPIYYAANETDFRRIAPGMDDQVGGFYANGIEDVCAVIAASRGRERQRDMHNDELRAFDPRLILFHEYTHHFQFAHMQRAMPRWHREGLADFLATVEFTKDGCIIGRASAMRVGTLQNQTWFPTRRMLDPMLVVQDSRMGIFYAQAWFMNHLMLMDTKLSPGLAAYLVALESGADAIAAFEPAFNITPEAFDDRLKAYFKSPLMGRIMPQAKIDVGVAMTVERLPPSANELLMVSLYARMAPRDAERANVIRRIRDSARSLPQDPFARWALATGETWCGDIAVARKLIDEMLAADATNAELHHLSGLCRLRAGYAANDMAICASAGRDFAKAYDLDNSRGASLYRHLEARFRGSPEIDDYMLSLMREAARIYPQIWQINVLLAQGLVRHNKHEEAVAVLRPLSTSAHRNSNPLLDKVLKAAETKSAPPPLTFVGPARSGDEGYQELIA